MASIIQNSAEPIRSLGRMCKVAITLRTPRFCGAGRKVGATITPDTPFLRRFMNRSLKRIARLAVVAIAGATLAVTVRDGLRQTLRQQSAGSVSAWKTTYRQEQCFYRVIHATVPKDARVVVREGGYYGQVLEE